MNDPGRTLSLKRLLWSTAVCAALVFLLSAPASAQVHVLENTTKHDLETQAAADLYYRIVDQMESRGWRITRRPSAVVRVLERKHVEKALERCADKNCAHILRLGAGASKNAPFVFLTISETGVDVWMDSPDMAFLGRAITVALDYENRLYLGPDHVREMAEAAASALRVAREGKISVNALRAQQ